MQYCDFASIMQIIRGGFMEGAFPNQMALVTKLFSDFLKEGTDDIFIDASQVNKWFHGTLKPSPSMSSFYAMDQINQDALADAFEDKVIPCLSDPEMVVEQIYELLIQDTSVSETKKQELIANREIADSCFLAAVLTFGMSRPFIARDIRKPEKNQNGVKSPSVQDYIFDAAAPKPCRTFCGRDSELDTLHTALEKKIRSSFMAFPASARARSPRLTRRTTKRITQTSCILFTAATSSGISPTCSLRTTKKAKARTSCSAAIIVS